MRILILLLSFISQIYLNQNTFKDISRNREKISKVLFKKILDHNTFNSSIVTRILFKKKNIRVYYISTFSPHAYVNVVIIDRKRVEIFELREKENISKLLCSLNQKYFIKKSDLLDIENKLNIYW